ncbi:fibronectin type III domain-containing protein [Actinoplanes sichuanensis]|uniref:Fibronectin type III domain-containing protein n=1 Tax=Actinoplanes sichuanensis TaxID=512349 RepID=A0ABW4AJ65_9ACTN|nr:fibronectin type III domain-containing protein [Actinoplanes sichuanensis]
MDLLGTGDGVDQGDVEWDTSLLYDPHAGLYVASASWTWLNHDYASDINDHWGFDCREDETIGGEDAVAIRLSGTNDAKYNIEWQGTYWWGDPDLDTIEGNYAEQKFEGNQGEEFNEYGVAQRIPDRGIRLWSDLGHDCPDSLTDMNVYGGQIIIKFETMNGKCENTKIFGYNVHTWADTYINSAGIGIANDGFSVSLGWNTQVASEKWEAGGAVGTVCGEGNDGGQGGGSDPRTRIMVVGDSISQGHEGDYTWRYRLAEHLKQSDEAVNFVGPYRGTTYLPSEQPAGFPTVSAPPSFDGKYRNNLSFDSDHFSQWGRQVAQTKNVIRGRVADYKPDYLLVSLGFNDLGWGVSTPDGLVSDIQTLITEARASKPDIRILVANVIQRSPMSNLPDLPRITDEYASKLAPKLDSLNTAASPVRLVDIKSQINSGLHTYDGLHPNGVGEFRIARAFANVLNSSFSLGNVFGTIPASVPDLAPTTPAWIRAVTTTSGIKVTWEHSFAASGYWLYQRDATVGGTFTRSALQIPADSWHVGWLDSGHRYEFYVVPTHGDSEGSASPTASAVADLRTASGPTNISVHPGASYVDFSWTPPSGAFSDTVGAYRVYYFDLSIPDAVVDSRYTADTNFRLLGLEPGHRYVFLVASVNAGGEGFPSVAAEAYFGFGSPQPPSLLATQITSPTDVSLKWSRATGATSYNIYSRDVVAGNTFAKHGSATNTSHQLGWLFPGADRWEWCIAAVNGTLEGPKSQCLRSQLDKPVLKSAKMLTATDVEVQWDPVPGASKYRVLNRNVQNGGDFTVDNTVSGTSHRVGWLFPGAQYFEWCVVAVTDNVESVRSNCMMSHS